MHTYALIENGTVVNVVVAPEGWPRGINITTLDPKPAIGWRFVGGAFVAPPVEPAPSPVHAPTHTHLMTHLAFLERMTAEEYGRFEGLMEQSVDARFAKAKFDMARDVNVLRTDVQSFAYTLRAVGVLLSDERVVALLALKPLSETGAINPLTGAVTA